MNTIAKANALVSQGGANDAIYLNNCLDEILKQLTRSRQSIDLFYSLYIKMLDRLFGEDVSRTGDLAAPWVKGVSGGWLRLLMSGAPGAPLNRPSHPTRRDDHLSSLPTPCDQLLSKFLPGSVMWEVLAKIQGGYEAKLTLLPAKMQMYIAEHPVYSAVGSKTQQYLSGLLSSPLHSAAQRSSIAQKGALVLDSFEYFLVCLLRYPTMAHNLLSPEPRTFGYSYSLPTSSTSNAVEVLQRQGVRGWIRGVPFLALLNEYLNEYLPTPSAGGGTGMGTGIDMGIVWSTGSGGTGAGMGMGGMGGMGVGALTVAGTGTGTGGMQSGQESQHRHAELFLTLAIQYWLDQAMVMHSEHAKAPTYRKLLSNVNSLLSTGELDLPGGGAGAPGGGHPHPGACEVVLLDSSSLRWTVASMQCSYLLVLRALADPALLGSLQQLGEGGMGRKGLGGSGGGGGQEGVRPWQKLQAPVYEMLRCVFVKGSASGVGSQVQSLALELWLVWLQPWSAPALLTGSGGGGSASGGGGGRREPPPPQWIPYIAANLHFYTTLLACYLRTTSEGSLSTSEKVGVNNLANLERVLGAFTPALLQEVDALANAFRLQVVPSHGHAMGGGGGMGGGMGVGVGAGVGGSGAGWRIGNEWGTDRHYAESGGGGEYGASSLPLLLGNSFTSPTRTRDRASLGLGDLGSAGSSGAYSTGEHATPTPPTPQLLRMARLQHENLYPDRRIDRLPDGGVTDFRAGVGGQAAVNLVSSLHQIDVNLKETQSWLAKYIDQRLAKLRTYCNLPQPPHPHRKHSARLGACMHSMVRIVPSSAAGMTTSVARGVEGEQRDLSGRLTEVGKACIVGGTVRVRVRDVLQPRALARDPLECPLCSYEWKPLALLMVALTRDLNHTMHLPRNDAYLMCSWYTVWRNAHAASRGWFPFAPVFADCFRLNLRPLARYRVFAPLLLWIACVLRRFGVLSTSLLLLLSAPLSYLMFENNFPQ